MLDLPFVFCNSAHCSMEAILSIFDVYELKVSLITNRFVFCMYYKCLPNVYFFSFVLFCIFQVFYALKKPHIYFYNQRKTHLYKKGTQLKDK